MFSCTWLLQQAAML